MLETGVEVVVTALEELAGVFAVVVTTLGIDEKMFEEVEAAVVLIDGLQ